MERLSVDDAPPDEARRLLRTCCGSTRWVERMMGRRPFGSRERMLSLAREIWFTLDPADWLQAFSDHPRIGDREALKEKSAETRHLASQEQAGVRGAAEDVLDALARGNDLYEKTFGYIFIVCATGLTARQMLDTLQRRLQNAPGSELRVAAEEQARITAIRLNTL